MTERRQSAKRWEKHSPDKKLFDRRKKGSVGSKGGIYVISDEKADGEEKRDDTDRRLK